MRRWLVMSALALFACSDSPTETGSVYTYTMPSDRGDGWEVASLSSVGIDRAPLETMVDRIRDGSYVNIHSVLLVTDGRLVFEEYFPGRTVEGRHVDWGPDDLHAMHSVTKSVTSLLVGIAIDEGLIPGVDEPIATYFPAVASDARTSHLTIRHLLTMSAGMEWDEHSTSYHDDRNSHVRMNRSGDPVGFVLALPMIAEPGATFRYNSGLSILLGEIIHRASGLRADEFADRHLFTPIGIEQFEWWRYGNGVVQTGGGLALSSRDAARIGRLFLNRGSWEGRRIVSEGWVEQSTAWRAGPAPREDYGYHWWGIRLPRHDNVFDLSDETLDATAAVGRGGQWVLVYREFDLVAVFTGGNDNALDNQPMDMLRRFVFPAVLGGQG